MKTFRTCLMILLVGCGKNSTSDIKPYDGQEFSGSGYGILVPVDWPTKRDVMGSDLIIVTPTGMDDTDVSENINIVCENLPDGISERRYLEATKEQLKRLTGNDILEDNVVELNGNQAIRIRYKLTMGAHKMDNDAYIIHDNNSAYVITLSMGEGESRDRWLIEFRDIANTFRIR